MQRLQTMYASAFSHIQRAYKSMLFPAAIVLLVVLGITFWASRTAQNSLDRNLEAGIQMQADSLEQSITNRFTLYILYLRGATSTIDATGTVDNALLERYIGAFRPSKSGATFDWLGVASPIDGAWQIRFIDPVAKADVSTQQVYEATAVRASQTNTVAVSSLGSEKNGKLVIARPYYLVPGGTQPAGVIFGVVAAREFFDRAIEDSDVNGVSVQIHSGDSADSPVLYSNAKTPTQYSKLSENMYSNSGQDFLLELNSDHLSLVNKTQLDGPLLIASGGALAGLLIASIVYLLLTARSRELQLQQVQDIDLAKDDLISLASHQLRTPATGVKQYLGMVLQGFAGTVTDSQRALLEKAYASNDRQLAVINEILHLAKIDSGRIVLAKRKTNIVHLVQDVVNEQDREIKAAGHTLKSEYPKQTIMLRVDDHMLRMAIENLLSNAIKYTDKGGEISVTVSTNSDVVIISVGDTGVGISESDLHRLFKQFARIPNRMSTRVSGTGVGLYLAKHLVELHGGSMEVESEPNEGSVFRIILPKRK